MNFWTSDPGAFTGIDLSRVSFINQEVAVDSTWYRAASHRTFLHSTVK
jgi:hypothetical protein